MASLSRSESSSTRPHKSLSFSSSDSPAQLALDPITGLPSSAPQRSRSVVRSKSSHTNLKTFIRRLRSKNSLDFGCSGSLDGSPTARESLEEDEDETLFGTAFETDRERERSSPSAGPGSPAESRRASQLDGPVSVSPDGAQIDNGGEWELMSLDQCR